MNITVKADLITLKSASKIYTGDLNGIRSVEDITASFTLQPTPPSYWKHQPQAEVTPWA